MNKSSSMNCGACGGATKQIGEKYGVPIFRCNQCRSMIANCEQPEDDFYEQGYVGSSLYGYEDGAKATTNIGMLDAAGRRRLEAVMAAEKIIEVGAGNGSFVRAALDHGLDIVGVERSQYMRKLASEVFGVELLKEIPSLPNTRLSLVLIEVIEHLKDPTSFLRYIFTSLGKPPENILLTTPNGEAENLLGIDWPQIKPPEHIILFTSVGMQKLLEHLGYSKFRFHRYHSAFLDYSLNKFGSRSNRKVPLLWLLTSLLRIIDPLICRMLPARFALGLECYCER